MPRPSSNIISRERAAKAALAAIDANGLSEISLNDVAARLGVRAPSLYYHFANKDELLAEVARLLLIEGQLPPLVPSDWREAIVQISLASWRSIMRHPKAAPLLLQFFPKEILMDAYEHWSRFLSINGVPSNLHMTILEATEKLTFGHALYTAAARTGGHPSMPRYDAREHPHFTEAVRSHRADEEQTFEQGLRWLLAGIQVD
jgi:TetR/AcrR family transcriptional regulator, tetracycline repressor protein